jgi:hypothetical protein
MSVVSNVCCQSVSNSKIENMRSQRKRPAWFCVPFPCVIAIDLLCREGILAWYVVSSLNFNLIDDKFLSNRLEISAGAFKVVIFIMRLRSRISIY